MKNSRYKRTVQADINVADGMTPSRVALVMAKAHLLVQILLNYSSLEIYASYICPRTSTFRETERVRRTLS